MKRGAAALVGIAIVAAVIVAIAARSPADARARLDTAVERSMTQPARIELTAVSEIRGGSGGQQRIHMVGELVPPARLHVLVDGMAGLREIVIVGGATWADAGEGLRRVAMSMRGPLALPTAPLALMRGSGEARFSGVGVVRGVPTYRVRLALNAADLQERSPATVSVGAGARGTIDIDIGLLDGLVHRQTVEIVEPTDPLVADAVRTSYTVEYWDHGQKLEVREPD